MNKVKIVMVFMIFFLFVINIAHADDEDNENGRYTIHIAEIDSKEVPLLLDTRTGKVWRYSGKSSFGKDDTFRGITVEGQAYSTEKKNDLDQKISGWASQGLIDKNIIGYDEAMSGEFSYSMDLLKAQQLNRTLMVEKKE
ncbi:MAG: hypothetical protein ABH862_03520 [Candidatus Omnitrophota bacterium]